MGITIIPEACTPAMTTTPATIHRIPMTPTPMTAEDGVAVVIVAGEVILAEAGVMEAAVVVEGIDSGAPIHLQA